MSNFLHQTFYIPTFYNISLKCTKILHNDNARIFCLQFVQ